MRGLTMRMDGIDVDNRPKWQLINPSSRVTEAVIFAQRILGGFLLYNDSVCAGQELFCHLPLSSCPLHLQQM